MPPILVPSSAKRIAQIVIIAKLNGRKGFILKGFVCDVIRPSKELPVQVNNLSTRIKCESCSVLRRSMLTIFQRRSSAFIFNCEHVSNFVLIADFEQTNACLVLMKISFFHFFKISFEYLKYH